MSSPLRHGSAKHTTHWSATLAIRPSSSEKPTLAFPFATLRVVRSCDASSHVPCFASRGITTPQPLKNLPRWRPLTNSTIALAARQIIPVKPEAPQQSPMFPPEPRDRTSVNTMTVVSPACALKIALFQGSLSAVNDAAAQLDSPHGRACTNTGSRRPQRIGRFSRRLYTTRRF
jgi:hypothetical protein